MEIPAISFPILGEGFVLNFLPYFTVFGWKIYWYGVLIAIGFLLAVFYAVKHAKEFGLTEDNVIDVLLWAVPLGIVGARLYYVIFYHDDAGINPYFDGQNDLRDIVAVWEGGLAIYGGVIGGVIGLFIGAKLKKVNARVMLDLCGFGLLIGQAIGRWGNFTNREAHGTETMVPWRMGLIYSFKTFYFHPTFLYESLWNVLGFLILHFFVRRRRKYDGQIFLTYVFWYGLGRLFIEGLRTDSLYVGNSNLRVSQLVAGLTCLLAAGVMIYIRMFRHPEAIDLWANREAKAAADAEYEAEAEAAAEEMTAEEFDEELSDAFRILRGENLSVMGMGNGEDEEGEVRSIEPEPAEEPAETPEPEPAASGVGDLSEVLRRLRGEDHSAADGGSAEEDETELPVSEAEPSEDDTAAPETPESAGGPVGIDDGKAE